MLDMQLVRILRQYSLEELGFILLPQLEYHYRVIDMALGWVIWDGNESNGVRHDLMEAQLHNRNLFRAYYVVIDEEQYQDPYR